jgi:hypothetical protein
MKKPEELQLNTVDGLELRQYVGADDDRKYLDLQKRNREHIAEFGNRVYEGLRQVREAREGPKGKMRLGIWSGEQLIGEAAIGENGDEAELGLWLDKNATGRRICHFGNENGNEVHASKVQPSVRRS